jgi:hypothetical protein
MKNSKSGQIVKILKRGSFLGLAPALNSNSKKPDVGSKQVKIHQITHNFKIIKLDFKTQLKSF